MASYDTFPVPECAKPGATRPVGPDPAAVGVDDGGGVGGGALTALVALSTRHRLRRKPAVPVGDPMESTQARATPTGATLVDLAYARHYGPIAPSPSTDDPTSEGK